MKKQWGMRGSQNSNVGQSDGLKNDKALQNFLSKEVKNDSPAFHDYPPTIALVRAANKEFLELLGVKK